MSEHKISLNQQIEEIARELEYRRKVYPRIAAKGSERPSVLEYRVKIMQQVKETLEWLRDNKALIKQRLSQ